MGQYHSPYLAMGNNPISMIDPTGGYSWGAFDMDLDTPNPHGFYFGNNTTDGFDRMDYKESKDNHKANTHDAFMKQFHSRIQERENRKFEIEHNIDLPWLEVSDIGTFSYDVHGYIQNILNHLDGKILQPSAPEVDFVASEKKNSRLDELLAMNKNLNSGSGYLSKPQYIGPATYRSDEVWAKTVGEGVWEGLAAEAPIAAIAKVASVVKVAKAANTAGRSIPTVAEQAASLSQKIGKNSITLRTPTKQIRFDFVGRAHGNVPTPHMQIYNYNFVNGVQKSVSRASKDAIPMTQQEIRMIRKYLEKFGN